MINEFIDSVKDYIRIYALDEIGQDERDKFEKMSDLDFLQLLLNTLTFESELNRDLEDIKDMFESDLIYNFNIGNY